jgi:hypothetical protein
MKKILILSILLVFVPWGLLAQPYYIDPAGDDGTGDGSTGSPWFSVAYAMNQCSAGDTVYAKSGTYDYDTTQIVNVSGSAGSYIVLTSEKGHPDSVIFDFYSYDMSGETPQQIAGIQALGDSYLKFEKISVRRVWKINTNDGRAHGFSFNNCDNIDFEWVKIDSMAGRGIMGYQCNTANIINCDISWCADPQDSDPGNAGTGILWYETTASSTDTLRITGCRFWQCADQGIGLITGNVTIVDSIWSWDNNLHAEGYTSGTGNGFKPSLGYNVDIDTIHLVLKRSIIAYNRFSGINENTSNGYKFNFHCYNNTIYNNGDYGIVTGVYTNDEDNEMIQSPILISL